MGTRIPLKRELGLVEVTLSGIGIILGAGIYALIGEGAALAGNALWLSFAISATIAIFTGLSYAELSAMFPRAGAEYEYVKVALGTRAAFVIGWLIILAGIIAASAVAIGFAGYASALAGIGPALSGLDHFLFAAGLVIGLSLLLTRGIKISALFASLFTLVEIGGLLLVILIGFPSLGTVDYLEMPLGPPGVLTAAALVFFAYIGFEDVVKLAEETRMPERNIPMGLLLAMAVSIVLYILVSVSAVSIAGWEALSASEAPFAAIAGMALGGGASILISAIALFATANTVLLLLLATSRICYGMAAAGQLPAVLGSVHATYGTPVWATLVVGAWASLFTLAGSISFVAELTNFALFLTFMVINATVILLRVRLPRHPRPFAVPGSLRGIPLLPVAGIAASAALLSVLDTAVIGLGALLAALGSAYALLRIPRSGPGSRPDLRSADP
jgi:APA family basic amino acid/polyamine antiporter